MNQKQIAAILLALVALGFVYLTNLVKNQLDLRVKESQQAQAAANAAMNMVTQERKQINELKTNTSDLISFLESWEPYFASLNSPQGAELAISMRLKEENLVTLAQRYERAGLKSGGAIPSVMRANIIVEDNYARTLNWIGRMERDIPTLRVSNLRITKGDMPGDIRAETVMEIPLAP